MADRPRFFDDLAGLAGNAFSAVTGAREELHAIVRSRVDEILNSLDLVRRDDFDAVQEMATRARMGQDAADARISNLESRLAALESLVSEEKGGPQG